MLTILFVLSLSLLDFQRPAIPDSIEKQFVVTELQEQTTGCATSPQAGRPTNHQIFIDQHAAGPQMEDRAGLALPLRYENPLPLGAGVNERNNVLPLENGAWIGSEATIQAAFDDGAEAPIRDATASCPEPPTLAILTISGVVLLYLLFGRQKKQRLYRRT